MSRCFIKNIKNVLLNTDISKFYIIYAINCLTKNKAIIVILSELNFVKFKEFNALV